VQRLLRCSIKARNNGSDGGIMVKSDVLFTMPAPFHFCCSFRPMEQAFRAQNQRRIAPLKSSFTAQALSFSRNPCRSAAMRRTLFAALTILSTAPAHAAGVSVMLDEVRTITFPKTVTTVFVGNPAIADINMIDSRHAFIMGKGYGSTNMLALDQDGKQISNVPISVLARQNATVTLQVGVGTEGRVTYTCNTLHCEMAPAPGDDKLEFDKNQNELSAHTGNAKTAANQP
jgi:hypothetical protein